MGGASDGPPIEEVMSLDDAVGYASAVKEEYKRAQTSILTLAMPQINTQIKTVIDKAHGDLPAAFIIHLSELTNLNEYGRSLLIRALLEKKWDAEITPENGDGKYTLTLKKAVPAHR